MGVENTNYHFITRYYTPKEYIFSMSKRIYHGSINIIEKTEFGIGKVRNDYGLGFYIK